MSGRVGQQPNVGFLAMKTDRVGDHALEQLCRRAREAKSPQEFVGRRAWAPTAIRQSQGTTTASTERTPISSSSTTGWSSIPTCSGATRPEIRTEPGAALSDRVERRRAHHRRRNTTPCSRTSTPRWDSCGAATCRSTPASSRGSRGSTHPTIQNLNFGTDRRLLQPSVNRQHRNAGPGGDRRHSASGTTGRPTSPSRGRSSG